MLNLGELIVPQHAARSKASVNEASHESRAGRFANALTDDRRQQQAKLLDIAVEEPERYARGMIPLRHNCDQESALSIQFQQSCGLPPARFFRARINSIPASH
jgi:hypothetical protein